jgi:hypothetical protein
MEYTNLTNSNFLLFAAHNYNNVSCSSIEEFEDDLKRLQYIKKLLSKYHNDKDLKVRLILNHIIILSNVFGHYNVVCMLFLKMPEYAEYFIPFLLKLNILPETVKYINNNIINTNSYTFNTDVDKLIDECFKKHTIS